MIFIFHVFFSQKSRSPARGLLSTQNSGFTRTLRRLSANSTVNRATSAMGHSSVDQSPLSPKAEDSASSFLEAADKCKKFEVCYTCTIEVLWSCG